MGPKYEVLKLKTEDNAVIEFVHIKGDGTPIILIPGAGDGLNTVGKFPYPYVLARMYKRYTDKHSVTIISRREPIPEGFTVRDFAKDYIRVMDELEIDMAHIETNSGGGPVGQWMAIDSPDRVRSLVLGATMAHVDDSLKRILIQWLEWSKEGQWHKLHVDSFIKAYTQKYYNKFKWLFPMARFMPKPENPDRMIRLLEGLINMDNRPYLNKIICPALVIGGDADEVTNLELQNEMASLIPNAKQIIIPGVGHGASQEASKEHSMNVLSFFDEVG